MRNALLTALHERKPMNHIASLTARTIEICIMFSLVSAVNALLTARHEQKPMNYIATLTARTIEICIIVSLVSAVNALLTALHERKPMYCNIIHRFSFMQRCK